MTEEVQRSIEFFIVDVFTDKAYGGNQLAVIPDGRGLSTESMQSIAHEFNFSETTFVLPPQDDRHTAKVRIFTPSAELPFAGHPNIGTAFVLATQSGSNRTDGETTLTFEEGAGLVRVVVRPLENGAAIECELTAPLPAHLGATAWPQKVADALALDVSQIETRRHEPRVAGAGIDFLCIELKTLDALERCRIPSAEQTFELAGGPQLLLYTCDTRDPQFDYRQRMFAPRMGVPEDPATGSAACALAGLLASLEPTGKARSWTLSQGTELGRPSVLRAFARADPAGRVECGVAGQSVLVASGHLHACP